MRNWNKFYRKEKNPFGTEPNSAVVYACEHAYLFPGTVLELGVGYGRNALYLAKEGFSVVGVDFSSVAIRRLDRYARERRVKSRVRGVVEDVTKFKFRRSYDNVVSTFMLHCIEKETSLGILEKAKRHTRVGGAHVIVSMLNRGPFYDAYTEDMPDGHFLAPRELKRIYSRDGWNVVRYSEFTVETHTKDKKGMPYQQPAAGVIATRVA